MAWRTEDSDGVFILGEDDMGGFILRFSEIDLYDLGG